MDRSNAAEVPGKPTEIRMKATRERTWEEIKRNCLLIAVCGALCGTLLLASSCSSSPYVCAGNPKVYDDAQTRVLMDKLNKDVRSNLPSITDSTPQSISATQQEYSKLFTLKVEPTGSSLASTSTAGNGNLRLTPVQASSYSDSSTALGFTQTLRERIRRQQDISRYEMLYIGDQAFLDASKSVHLVRLDLSLLLAKSLRNREYLLVDFRLEPGIGLDSASVAKNVKIYALAPDYASAVSEDSLLSLGMRGLNGAAGASVKGLDVSAEGNLQKQVEEYFASTNETPVQFAIPRCSERTPAKKDEKPPIVPGYAFAFGPQRHIIERSWINPNRWFGDTFIVAYEFVPSNADCYALLVVDKDLFKSSDVANLKLSVNVFESLDALSSGVDWNSSSRDAGNFEIELRTPANTPDMKLSLAGNAVNANAVVAPSSINPAVASTIIVTTREIPVTPATAISVDGIAIAPANTTVLGKHMLKAVIPETSALKGFNADTPVECVMSTPGYEGVERFNLTIRKSEASGKSPAALSLAPSKGRAGEAVTISSSDTTKYPLSSATKVVFGNSVITNFLYQGADKIVFNAPEPGKDIAASVGVAIYPCLDKFVDLKFSYEAPVTATPDSKSSSASSK